MVITFYTLTTENIKDEVMQQEQFHIDYIMECDNLNIEDFEGMEVTEIQQIIGDELDNSKNMTMYFSGFTNEDSPIKDQIECYEPMFDLFLKDTQNIVYPWHSEASFYKLGDFTKTIWNSFFSSSKYKLETVYRSALENSFTDARNLVKDFEEHKIYQSNRLNFVGFSLGTQFIFNTLVYLQAAKNNNGRDYKVQNVILMGGVLSAKWLYQKLHEFIGEDGVVKGRFIIVSSHNDWVLKYLLGTFKVNSVDTDFDGFEENNTDAIGRGLFNYKDALKNVNRSEGLFQNMKDNDILEIIKDKVKLIDASSIIDTNGHRTALGHLGYMKRKNLEPITHKVSSFVV